MSIIPKPLGRADAEHFSRDKLCRQKFEHRLTQAGLGNLLLMTILVNRSLIGERALFCFFLPRTLASLVSGKGVRKQAVGSTNWGRTTSKYVAASQIDVFCGVVF